MRFLNGALQRSSFLVLNAILGLVSIALMNRGLPFGWLYYSGDQSWYLILPYLINLALILAAVVLLFLCFRNLLFKHGKPYLAIFVIFCWVLGFLFILKETIRDRENSWAAIFAVSNSGLTERIHLLSGGLKTDPESLESAFSNPEQFKLLCQSFLLSDQQSFSLTSDVQGLPVNRVVDKASFSTFTAGRPCPTDVHRIYEVNKQNEEILSDLTSTDQLILQANLISHPDFMRANRGYIESVKHNNNKDLEVKSFSIDAMNKMLTEGQLVRANWINVADSIDRSIVYSVNPRVWRGTDKESGEPVLYYWVRKIDKNHRPLEDQMLYVDCSKANVINLVFGLVHRSPDNPPVRLPLMYKQTGVAANSGSVYFLLNKFACGDGVQRILED